MQLHPFSSLLCRGLPRILAAAFIPIVALPAQGRGEGQLRQRLLAEARTLVSSYNEQDRRTLGNALVDQFLRRKDPESAAELAVEIDVRDGYVFGRIAQVFVEAGDTRRAMAIASLPRDSTARDAAFMHLAYSFVALGPDAVDEVISAMSDPQQRLNALIQVSHQGYRASPRMTSLLQKWWPRFLSDTTREGRQRATQLATAMLQQRDLSGLRALNVAWSERTNLFYQMMSAASQLRSRGDVFADSVFAAAVQMVRAEADSAKRNSLDVIFWQQYVPPSGEAHWRKTADSLQNPTTRRTYLTTVAGRRAQQGDYRSSEQIADLFFASGDTNTARNILHSAAQSLSYGYAPYAATPPSVSLRLAQRVIDTGKNMDPARDHLSKSARAIVYRLSIEQVRQLAQDPAFPQMDQQIQQSAINALMSVDLQAGLALALMLPDSVRASRHLRSGAERLVSAGMLDAALGIVARIPVPAQRVSPLGQAMQRKMQSGDTVGVRSMLGEVMNVIDFRADSWVLSETIMPVALKMGMLDDMLAWASRLPFETRAFVIVAVLGKIGE